MERNRIVARTDRNWNVIKGRMMCGGSEVMVRGVLCQSSSILIYTFKSYNITIKLRIDKIVYIFVDFE